MSIKDSFVFWITKNCRFNNYSRNASLFREQVAQAQRFPAVGGVTLDLPSGHIASLNDGTVYPRSVGESQYQIILILNFCTLNSLKKAPCSLEYKAGASRNGGEKGEQLKNTRGLICTSLFTKNKSRPMVE